MDKGNMSAINFTAKLSKIGSWTVLQLPKSASHKLPSRGLTMVDATIKGSKFKIPLEPDGKAGHWFQFTNEMQKATGAQDGDTINITMEPTSNWPNPEVSLDFKKALAVNPKVQALWTEITPNARWDWIRWIRGTKNPQTRAHRIEVAISKLKSGMRRPCCFNRNMCSEPEVSNNGVLRI